MDTVRKIIRLDPGVVNKIAAGEVVQRPVSALKELLENSLDASAWEIQVCVKEGGLKLLQIQDNGSGIRSEDLPLVCERFATSKLQKFEDLSTIATFGFRGEALASISHVAHVTLLTRTKDSVCAYKASYMDGKLQDNPKPCAGNPGTSITVEDLFYNLPTRKKAFRSNAEEHSRIADIISRYAVHNPHCGFSLTKQGSETERELRTPANSSTVDNIRSIYGPAIAKELIPFEWEDPTLRCNFKGYFSSLNFTGKKLCIILFINGRLVESQGIKKAVEAIYTSYLPKGSHPWVYLALQLPPEHVDVNVSPTKHQVIFLHEDAIVEGLQRQVDQALFKTNSSRTFQVQSVLSHVNSGLGLATNVEILEPNKTAKIYDKYLVRTDAREQTLDTFLTPATKRKVSNEDNAESSSRIPLLEPETVPGGVAHHTTAERQSFSEPEQEKRVSLAPKRDFGLTSVKELRLEIQSEASNQLREIIREHTFVGCINEKWALIQYQVNLYLANTIILAEEYFYQLMIQEFGNFGYLTFSEALPLEEVFMLGLADPEVGWNNAEEDGPKEELSQAMLSVLMERRSMLDEYFSFRIEADQKLYAIPLLLEGYIPNLHRIPAFLTRLSTEVNWDSEKPCFQTLCRQVASFYARIWTKEGAFGDRDWAWSVQHILYPAMKKELQPPKTMAEKHIFVQVTSLPDLYKVFERC